MMMKLLSRVIAALLVGSVNHFVPAAAAAPPGVTVTGSASVVSHYMFRGLLVSGASFQPSVEVGASNLTLGIWSSVPFDPDKVPGSSDPEVDLYGTYNFALSDAVSLVPGFNLYHFPNVSEALGFYRWTFEPTLALNYSVNGWRFTPKVYYEFGSEGATFELTAFYAFPLKNIGSELDFTATIGTYKWNEYFKDAIPSVKAWGDYWLLGVAMPFQFSLKSNLSVGFAYTEGREAFTKAGSLGRKPNASAVGRGVVTITYLYSF